MNRYRQLGQSIFGCKQRILIVATQQAVWTDFQTVLRHQGCDVKLVGRNVEVLWQILHDDRPDLIVLEMEPSHTDNYHLAHAIQTHKDIPIVVVSSTADDAIIVRAISAFAEDFIIRPVYAVELMMRIRRVLLSARHLSIRPAQNDATPMQTTDNLGLSLA